MATMDNIIDVRVELDKIPKKEEGGILTYGGMRYTFTVISGENEAILPGYRWFIHSVKEKNIWEEGMTALCNVFCDRRDTGLTEIFEFSTDIYVYYQANNYPRGPLFLRFAPFVDEELFDRREFCHTNKEEILNYQRKERYYCRNKDGKWTGYRSKDSEHISTKNILRILEAITDNGYFSYEDHPDMNMEIYDNSRYLRSIVRYRKTQAEVENGFVGATGADIRHVAVEIPGGTHNSDLGWKIGLSLLMVFVALAAIFYAIFNRRAIGILNK
ncbi:hypothetical protein BEWA_044950 [Theileria equi strain WA]|uniref:Uncharacterized protein n=1 Tax=Theileria equi strain WA TaxID=1537102 RepID=L1LGM9_THEEQ|nr:hypothetical protein BEWA_044950 [Theileria equi strain WA]EKX74415.1 hypothetical protein BEWA_044950 [Theileria equi strain WA]|eukprot:XP_004833867.1 hypothetical protein BEWA_044950 [Theileria equi strain WA]